MEIARGLTHTQTHAHIHTQPTGTRARTYYYKRHYSNRKWIDEYPGEYSSRNRFVREMYLLLWTADR